ncbi:MAG: hypothetical protein R2845_08490 [Thermomicrobiales bacterium]
MRPDAGIQPITGAEITLVDGSHITLLAESQLGYQNLCKLLTAAHRTVRTNTTLAGGRRIEKLG